MTFFYLRELCMHLSCYEYNQTYLWLYQVLRAMKMKCAHSAFPNVKSLELRCCLHYYKQVVGVLEMFSQLEILVMKNKKEDGHQDDN